MENRELKCEERIDRELEKTINDLKRLWEAFKEGKEEVEDLGTFHDYGLCFDYVPPNTFTDQKRGYYRYQLSWGGPSDEFRFYGIPFEGYPVIEYWFLDWFDGASRELAGEDYELLREIWEYFNEIGLTEKEGYA